MQDIWRMWLMVEHVLVFVLLVSVLLLLLKKPQRRNPSATDYLSKIDAIKAAGGPAEIMKSQHVYAAGAASMDMDSVGEGGVVTHRDGRGAIYRFKLGTGVYVNMYYTKSGYRRSGDLHDCAQFDVVLKGRTRLRLINPDTGAEEVREYKANDFIVIPARTPHMFEFLEDNYLLEWWDSEFKAWYYRPYRSVIEANAPLEQTARQDFSIALQDLLSEGSKDKSS